MNKKWIGGILIAFCFGNLFFLSPDACAMEKETSSAQNVTEKQKKVLSEEERIELKKQKTAAKKLKEQKKNEAKKFEQIYRDGSYIYYLDKENMKWLNIPYQDKRMLDVWIKLEPVVSDGDMQGEDSWASDTAAYYLEHYFIRTDKRQIQFLCELEVRDRPNNDVQTGTYDPRKWENLVPESIEDHIYHGVVNAVGSGMFNSASSSNFGISGLGDLLEDVFRISL